MCISNRIVLNRNGFFLSRNWMSLRWSKQMSDWITSKRLSLTDWFSHYSPAPMMLTHPQFSLTKSTYTEKWLMALAWYLAALRGREKLFVRTANRSNGVKLKKSYFCSTRHANFFFKSCYYNYLELVAVTYWPGSKCSNLQKKTVQFQLFQVQLYLNCIILISFCCVCVFLFMHLLVQTLSALVSVGVALFIYNCHTLSYTSK